MDGIFREPYSWYFDSAAIRAAKIAAAAADCDMSAYPVPMRFDAG
jgi:hypothetical protein